MAGENPSINMNMPLPGVGVTEGPQWATDLNSSLTIVDAHNHTLGSGLLITPSAMDINIDLTMAGNDLTNARSIALVSNVAVLPPADIRAVYSSGIDGDLFYNDGNGNPIQLTVNGAISGTVGNISGLVIPASASYNSFSKTLFWKSDDPANVAATMDMGLAILRNLTPAAPGLTLQPALTMAGDISITFPAALPSATAAVLMDTSGNIVPSTGKYLAFCPTGVVLPFASNVVPQGWLYCDGASVSRTTYADLFATIGTAYGTASGTTFNLPDMRGMFMRGFSNGSGTDPDAGTRFPQTTGGASGDALGSGQAGETRVFSALSGFASGNTGNESNSHTHAYGGSGGSAGANFGSQFTALGTPTTLSTGVQSANHTHTLTAGVTIGGGTGGAETRPINLYFNYIIKT